MDPLATVTALENWLGDDLSDSFDRAFAMLDHASALVRIAAGETWSSGAVPDGIPQLVVRVAARMWPNPNGLRSSTTGPFSGTFAENELTPAEKSEVWAIVHPGERRGLGTISTTRGPLETESVWVNVGGSDKPIAAISREPW